MHFLFSFIWGVIFPIVLNLGSSLTVFGRLLCGHNTASQVKLPALLMDLWFYNIIWPQLLNQTKFLASTLHVSFMWVEKLTSCGIHNFPQQIVQSEHTKLSVDCGSLHDPIILIIIILKCSSSWWDSLVYLVYHSFPWIPNS